MHPRNQYNTISLVCIFPVKSIKIIPCSKSLINNIFLPNLLLGIQTKINTYGDEWIHYE